MIFQEPFVHGNLIRNGRLKSFKNLQVKIYFEFTLKPEYSWIIGWMDKVLWSVLKGKII